MALRYRTEAGMLFTKSRKNSKPSLRQSGIFVVIITGLAVPVSGYWLFSSSEVISIRDTVERNGMIYKVNSTRPFTG